MQLADIVDYWKLQAERDKQWFHPEDEEFLGQPNSFNLEYPVVPYVGDIVNAAVIILAANGGYDEHKTSLEFVNRLAVDQTLTLVSSPSSADWSKYRAMPLYYEQTNYGDLIVNKTAALINACAYRSKKITTEKDNQRLIKRMPSCNFNRAWLRECILPLARAGDKLVIGKRYGLWQLNEAEKKSRGMELDPAPISPRISKVSYTRMYHFLSS